MGEDEKNKPGDVDLGDGHLKPAPGRPDTTKKTPPKVLGPHSDRSGGAS